MVPGQGRGSPVRGRPLARQAIDDLAKHWALGATWAPSAESRAPRVGHAHAMELTASHIKVPGVGRAHTVELTASRIRVPMVR